MSTTTTEATAEAMLDAAAALTEAARPLEPAEGIAPAHLLAHLLGARHAGAWGTTAALLAGRLEILQAAAEAGLEISPRPAYRNGRPLEGPQHRRALETIAAAAPTNGPGSLAVAHLLAEGLRTIALVGEPGGLEPQTAYALRLLERPRPVRAVALGAHLASLETLLAARLAEIERGPYTEERGRGVAEVIAARERLRLAADGLATPDRRL